MDITQFIEDFNRAWMEHDWFEIQNHLHDKVVFAPSNDLEVVGKAQCVDTIKNFVNQFKTDSITILSCKKIYAGSTCVARWKYNILYRSEKKVFNETSSELWVLVQENEHWKLLFRNLLG